MILKGCGCDFCVDKFVKSILLKNHMIFIHNYRDFLSNFWTNRAREYCDHSKWPELPQNFKILSQNFFFKLKMGWLLPDLLLPKANSVKPGAHLGPTQILSPIYFTCLHITYACFKHGGQNFWLFVKFYNQG